eukprot:6248692-Alexandrium_andersonii.AAC.1
MARINPVRCLAAFSTEPLGCGPWAGGASETAWSPNFSATPARGAIKAGSLSILSRTLPWRPSLRTLDTAWSTVSSRNRPLRKTGRARIAREARSLGAKT